MTKKTMTTEKRAAKSASQRARRATKTEALPLVLVTAPEPAAPALGVDEAPLCELCSEPAGEGNALCPACADTEGYHQSVARLGLAVDEPVIGDIVPAPKRVDEPAVVVEVPVMTRGQGKSAVLGRTVVRWLRDQQRRGGALTLESEQDIVDQARCAWRAALVELGRQEVSA